MPPVLVTVLLLKADLLGDLWISGGCLLDVTDGFLDQEEDDEANCGEEERSLCGYEREMRYLD
jgi:hypothetical protein